MNILDLGNNYCLLERKMSLSLAVQLAPEAELSAMYEINDGDEPI